MSDQIRMMLILSFAVYLFWFCYGVIYLIRWVIK